MRSEKNYFGTINGQDVHLFSLVNSNGVTVKISNYGGTITSILVPNASGNVEEISCGFNTLAIFFTFMKTTHTLEASWDVIVH